MISDHTSPQPLVKVLPSRHVMTVPEAASMLGVGRNTLYDAVKRGEVPVIRIGRRILVPVPAIERLLLGGEMEAEHD